MHGPIPDLQTIDELYDASRFMECWELTEGLWTHPEILDTLGPTELVMAGRLAHRLGGDKWMRAILRLAWKRYPDAAIVRYYARHAVTVRPSMYQETRDMDREPDLNTDDPRVLSSWYGSSALHWASLRDVDRAMALIEKARALGLERAWVDVCAAHVMMMDDQWDESLMLAERAWAASPGMPTGAQILAQGLSRAGRIQEAAERLEAHAKLGQSYEVTRLAVWYLCAMGERAFPGGHHDWAERARALAATILDQAPLADRDTRYGAAMAEFDIALLLNDSEAMDGLVDRLPPRVFSDAIKRMRETRDAKRTVLPVRPLQQKYNTCMPTSIASALGGLGVEMDEDDLAREIEHGGVLSWVAEKWLRDHGYAFKHFIAKEQPIRDLLAAGVPFVFTYKWETSGHATVAMGLDEATGTLLIHDPSRERWSRFVLENLGSDEAPLGPEAMAIVPPDKAALLDVIPDELSAPLAAYNEYFSIADSQGAVAAAPVLERLRSAYPDDAMTQFLSAVHQSSLGETGECLAQLTELLRRYPKCLNIRRRLIYTLESLGNTARLRQALEELVNQKLLPGLEVTQTWHYPPSPYVCRYVDLLAQSADHWDEAEHLMLRTLERNAGDGQCWFTMGQLLLTRRREAEALLPLRMATCLDAERHHYARTYCDLLRDLGREAEGLAFLRARAERLSRKVRGAVCWLTLVDAQEDYGYPDEATASLEAAMAAHPENMELVSYATAFWLRMGDRERATEMLERLAASDHRIAYLDCLSRVQESAGDWRAARETYETWLRELPDAVHVYRMLSDCIARAEGRAAALAQAQLWMAAHPEHELFEDLVGELQDRLHQETEARAGIKTRVARNPDDATSWRAIAYRLASDMAAVPAARKEAFEAELDEAVAACVRTAPDHPATLVLRGRLLEHRGDVPAACELYLAALDREPASMFAMRQVWNAIASWPADRQATYQAKLEDYLLRTVGNLHGARDLAFMIASRFGLPAAEAAVTRWRESSPDDPELIEAQVDLLMDYGGGRSDTERALAILEPAVQRFPSHNDLQFSLARAYSILLRRDDEIAFWRQYQARWPRNNQSRYRLASLLRHGGDPDDFAAARRELEAAIAIDPLDDDATRALSQFLWEAGEFQAAVDNLLAGLAHMPENIGLREHVIERLFDIEQDAKAVAVAQEAVELYPDGAYCWYMLATAKSRSEHHSDAADIESDYRKALQFNPELFDAADELVVLLASRQRFEDARAVLKQQEVWQQDQSPVRGRLAWLSREEGRRGPAIDEMAAVLKDWPRYSWGWHILMDWLEEDEDHDRTRAIFTTMPPEMVDMVDFRARRLILLAAAGIPEDELGPEWDRLLADFPRVLTIHLRRYDMHWAKELYADADTVLTAIEPYHSTAPALMARRCQVHAHQGHHEQAVALAVAVWTLPDDDERHTVRRCWDALDTAKQLDPAVDAFIARIQAGDRPRDYAVFLAATHLLKRKKKDAPADTDWYGSKAMRAFLDLLTDTPWDSAKHRGSIICAWGEEKPLHAIDWYRGHRELCEPTPVWEQVGVILMGTDRPAARVHYANWREKEGLGMFAVCNYLIALRDPADTEPELIQTMFDDAHEALQRLTPDDTIRYLAITLCEAAFRLEHYEDLLGALQAYAYFFQLPEDDEHFYMTGNSRALVDVLTEFATVLTAENTGEALAALARIKPMIMDEKQCPDWLKKRFKAFLRTYKSGGHLPITNDVAAIQAATAPETLMSKVLDKLSTLWTNLFRG